MAFNDLFKDSNDLNEKSIVGFLAFTIMTLFALVDLVTGYFGRELVISETIYNSFLLIVLGSFGISSVEKIMNRKTQTGVTDHTEQEGKI